MNRLMMFDGKIARTIFLTVLLAAVAGCGSDDTGVTVTAESASLPEFTLVGETAHDPNTRDEAASLLDSAVDVLISENTGRNDTTAIGFLDHVDQKLTYDIDGSVRTTSFTNWYSLPQTQLYLDASGTYYGAEVSGRNCWTVDRDFVIDDSYLPPGVDLLANAEPLGVIPAMPDWIAIYVPLATAADIAVFGLTSLAPDANWDDLRTPARLRLNDGVPVEAVIDVQPMGEMLTAEGIEAEDVRQLAFGLGNQPPPSTRLMDAPIFRGELTVFYRRLGNPTGFSRPLPSETIPSQPIFDYTSALAICGTIDARAGKSGFPDDEDELGNLQSSLAAGMGEMVTAGTGSFTSSVVVSKSQIIKTDGNFDLDALNSRFTLKPVGPHNSDEFSLELFSSVDLVMVRSFRSESDPQCWIGLRPGEKVTEGGRTEEVPTDLSPIGPAPLIVLTADAAQRVTNDFNVYVSLPMAASILFASRANQLANELPSSATVEARLNFRSDPAGSALVIRGADILHAMEMLPGYEAMVRRAGIEPAEAAALARAATVFATTSSTGQASAVTQPPIARALFPGEEKSGADHPVPACREGAAGGGGGTPPLGSIRPAGKS